MRIAVGMSGGVDSSVAAHLLLEAGHDVTGVLMKIWSGPEGPPGGRSACYGHDEAEDIRAARDVCGRLGIPLHIIDCARSFEETVLRDLRAGYLAGTTPNPCVRCNQAIKFGLLPEVARRSGLVFERFATGHYARIEYKPSLIRFMLKRGVDTAKDTKTGKEQKVEIKAGSGLSVEEIAKMVSDAEAHREEDRKFHDLVQARNHADALIHTARNTIKEQGEKVPGDVIGRTEGAIAELETAMKGDDKGQIEAKSKALEEAAQSLFAAASAGQPGAEAAGPGPAGGHQDDVVDAEFTEVKDDKKP